MARYDDLGPDDLRSLLSATFGEDETGLAKAVSTINSWIDRADGVAVYENEDLRSPLLGHLQFVSFGSVAAQLEIERAEDLPLTLPDIGGVINWRYRLRAIYNGKDKL